MPSAFSRTASSPFETLTPPPFPRPPAWICAFTTQTSVFKSFELLALRHPQRRGHRGNGMVMRPALVSGKHCAVHIRCKCCSPKTQPQFVHKTRSKKESEFSSKWRWKQSYKVTVVQSYLIGRISSRRRVVLGEWKRESIQRRRQRQKGKEPDWQRPTRHYLRYRRDDMH